MNGGINLIGLEKSIIYELGTFEAEVYSVEVFNYEELMISITLKNLWISNILQNILLRLKIE